MISRKAILSLMEVKLIEVSPGPVNVGPNSIDLRLGDELKTYSSHRMVGVSDPVTGNVYPTIDPRSPPGLVDVPKVNHPDYPNHWLLVPGRFYLGCTMEETFCRGVVPHLDGRSTCGRLSIGAHKTAGVGDNGYRGRWTLEIEVAEAVLVSPGDRLFQLYFTPAWGSGLARIMRDLFDDVRVSTDDHGSRIPDYRDVVRSLVEMNDLYGKTDSHYQGSEEVRGASPLD